MLVLALLALLAGGCAASATTSKATTPAEVSTKAGPKFHASTDDDVKAAATLAALMRAHPELGFVVLSQDADRIGVQRRRAKFLLQPRMSGPGGINRIIVIQLYAVKDEFRGHEQQLKDVCHDINATYDFITTYLQPTIMGTLFVAQSQITFGDDITLGFLGRYLDELKQATLIMASKTLVVYLK